MFIISIHVKYVIFGQSLGQRKCNMTHILEQMVGNDTYFTLLIFRLAIVRVHKTCEPNLPKSGKYFTLRN
jgi:hypothetical protein